jgi:hypothetical protein
MKKIAASPVLACTVITVLLALTAGVTLYVRYFFIGAIVAALATGMAVFLLVRKTAAPLRFFNKQHRTCEDGTIAKPVSFDNASNDAAASFNKEAIGEDGILPDTNDILLITLADTIPELNVKAGLAHVGKNNEVYFKTLRRFCKEYDEYIREIVRLAAEENWTDYSAMLRLLKDLFATMGNEHLSAWAHKLESAFGIYDNAICRNETEPFCYAMYQFKENLAAIVCWEAVEDENNE